MNLRQIEYAIAVQNHLSFGEAASQCYITQSTLSTMIGRLEDELGVVIFDRSTKPITITNEGKKVLSQLKCIQREIDSLEEVVDEIKGNHTGNIHIGVIPTIAPYLLPIFLNQFINEFPKVQFSVSELTTDEIISQLNQRTIDIGIVSTPLEEPKLIETFLYNEPFLLFDAKERPNIDVDIHELKTKRLWILEEGHCMRNQVENICNLKSNHSPYPNLNYQSGSLETLIKLVKAHKGTTFLPSLAVQEMTKEQQKHIYKFSNSVPSRSVGLIVHQHFTKSEILSKMEQIIKKRVQPFLKKVDSLKIISPKKINL